MKAFVIVTAVIAALCLAGCKKTTEPAAGEAAGPHGRYVGVGIYGAGSMWAKMVLANQPKDPRTPQAGSAGPAGLLDDEHVIVVVDSKTGEIRQCGDLSGYCIGMNPWSKPLTPSQSMPVSLTAHMTEPSTSDAIAASDKKVGQPVAPK
jgi:hypothetical protein